MGIDLTSNGCVQELYYMVVDVMPSPKTIDTLKWARKYFNFNSNKLDYIAKYLGVGQKMDTGGLRSMERYCI
jgi:hypothetical protein